MNEAFGQGLIITALGMGLVFGALGLLLLVMKLLDRVFRPKPVPEAVPSIPVKPSPDLGQIAALAVALALADEPCLSQARPGGRRRMEGGLQLPEPAGTRSGSSSEWRRGGRSSFWLPGR